MGRYITYCESFFYRIHRPNYMKTGEAFLMQFLVNMWRHWVGALYMRFFQIREQTCFTEHIYYMR